MMRGEIIAVDCDETLTHEVAWEPSEVALCTPKKEFIEKINTLYRHNFIVIYTARRDELMTETFKWLKKHGVLFHAVSNIKIPSAKYIDDKALHIDDIDSLLG